MMKEERNFVFDVYKKKYIEKRLVVVGIIVDDLIVVKDIEGGFLVVRRMGNGERGVVDRVYFKRMFEGKMVESFNVYRNRVLIGVEKFSLKRS